jgi:hypothetical protein
VSQCLSLPAPSPAAWAASATAFSSSSSGGNSCHSGGGAAGKAINLNGYTATTSGSGTTYGGIS